MSRHGRTEARTTVNHSRGAILAGAVSDESLGAVAAGRATFPSMAIRANPRAPNVAFAKDNVDTDICLFPLKEYEANFETKKGSTREPKIKSYFDTGLPRLCWEKLLFPACNRCN